MLHYLPQDEDGVGLSDQEIQDEVDTFMFEGHDTTASGLSWMMVNMARHPEYQSRCRQEIDALIDTKQTDDIEWYVTFPGAQLHEKYMTR